MRKKNVNRMYKDRLFRLVFHKKSDLLDLYNAVNQSDYKDSEALEITTLGDVVYMGMKNDISFLIDDILNLYEHQSTYNPNMPARGLLYLADLYQKHIESRKLNLYSSRLVRLPFPQFLVFYNGQQEEPDRLKLKLSDAFEQPEGMDPCLEFKAVMVNINLGHNRELMERCKRLKEYAQFIAAVRSGISEGFPLDVAVDAAVEICIRQGILEDILSAHRAEVHDMVLTEYDEQSHMASEREEWREEGKAEIVLDLLGDIGEVPQEIREKVMDQRELAVLKRWVKLAVKADSIEEFILQM